MSKATLIIMLVGSLFLAFGSLSADEGGYEQCAEEFEVCLDDNVSGEVGAKGFILAPESVSAFREAGSSRSVRARGFALTTEGLPPALKARVTGPEPSLQERIDQRLQRNVKTSEHRAKAFYRPLTEQASQEEEGVQK